MKTIIKTTLLLFICCISFAQTNLLDTTSWTLGTGSVPGYSVYGSDNENVREMGVGPHSTSILLWKTIPEVTGNATAGGWSTSEITIDHTKTYRLTVWIKKTNSLDGTTVFRGKAYDNSGNVAVNYMSGDAVENPFFWTSDVPLLDSWYLLVAYMHSSNYNETVSIGGVYDISGVKVSNISDYKFQSTASTLNSAIWLASNNNPSDSQLYYAPTVYEVNGQEPTIEQLVNNNEPDYDTGGGGDDRTPTTEGYWSLNDQDVFFNTGNVGIGTDTPDEKLSVNGAIHAKEVRVDLSNWPDYVFTKEYDLPTLKEIEAHIKTKGHLPNIPSAKEVVENGIQLGEMNVKLLEKIEELTLYLLQQEKELQTQKDKTNKLEESLIKLESLIRK